MRLKLTCLSPPPPTILDIYTPNSTLISRYERGSRHNYGFRRGVVEADHVQGSRLSGRRASYGFIYL